MDYKLTSVKILRDLYKKFKYKSLADEFTLQKLVNRSMDLYLMDDDFKTQINEWESIMRKQILKASRLNFQAHIEKHRINVENLLNNTVGVAEHPDILETIEKEINMIAEYDDKLEMLDKYFFGKTDKEVMHG